MIIFLRWGKAQSAAILLVNNWSLAVHSGVSCMFEKYKGKARNRGHHLHTAVVQLYLYQLLYLISPQHSFHR